MFRVHSYSLQTVWAEWEREKRMAQRRIVRGARRDTQRIPNNSEPWLKHPSSSPNMGAPSSLMTNASARLPNSPASKCSLQHKGAWASARIRSRSRGRPACLDFKAGETPALPSFGSNAGETPHAPLVKGCGKPADGAGFLSRGRLRGSRRRRRRLDRAAGGLWPAMRGADCRAW